MTDLAFGPGWELVGVYFIAHDWRGTRAYDRMTLSSGVEYTDLCTG